MANNQPNDHHESTQMCEYQKLNGNEFKQAEVKTITNIYYDCLEQIFDFLDILDLLNVARTCKRLQIAAAAKFGDAYGKKFIIILPFFGNHGIHFLHADLIRVHELKLCLPFLRCFGSKILNLRVILDPDSYLDQYINQYCVNTLTRIEFHHQMVKRFLFTKPFTNVESLDLNYTCLRDKLPSLVKWFPKLRHLEMYKVCDNSSPFGVHFPHLEHVTFYIDCNTIRENVWTYHAITDPNVRDKLTIENAKDFFHANQQLSRIHIDSYDVVLTLTTLLNMISRNPSILTLRAGSARTDVHIDELKRLTSEHCSIEALHLDGYFFTSDDVIFIIRQLNSLKKMSIEMKNGFECDRLSKQLGSEWKYERTRYLIDGINIDTMFVKLTR